MGTEVQAVRSEPTTLRRDMICRAIRAGTDPHTAAGRAGIDRTTFDEWMRRGEHEMEGPYRDFFEAIEKAQFAVHYRA